MKSILFKAADRGTADYGWLKPNYYFSFAQYPKGGVGIFIDLQRFLKPLSERPKRLHMVVIGSDHTKSYNSLRVSSILIEY